MTLCPQPDGSVLQFIPAPVLPVGMGLTPKQMATLNWLRGHFAEHGTSPTLDEIQRGLGASSRTSVLRRLLALQARGYITRQRGVHRSIKLTTELNHGRSFPA